MKPDADMLLLARCAEGLATGSIGEAEGVALDRWWSGQRQAADRLIARLLRLPAAEWTTEILAHRAHAHRWYVLLAGHVDLDGFAAFMLENRGFPAFLPMAERALAAQITSQGRAALLRNIADEQLPVPHAHLMRRLMLALRDRASPTLALASFPELTDRTLAFHYGYFRDPWALVGALYVTEAVAFQRLTAMDAGLRRLGLDAHAREFITIHLTCDEDHAREWSEDVIAPSIAREPDLAAAIARGIAVTLDSSARYLDALVDRFQAQRTRKVA